MSANAGRFPPALQVLYQGRLVSLMSRVPLLLRPKRQAAKPTQSVDSRNTKNASRAGCRPADRCVGASFGIPSVPPPRDFCWDGGVPGGLDWVCD